MSDYSHVSKITTDMVARHLAGGGKATDEMYLEALERIEPPLLDPNELELVRRELDPMRCRCGRPAKWSVRVTDVGLRIAEHPRSDVPARFLRSLSARLQDRNSRYTEVMRSQKFDRSIATQRRDHLIRGIYRQLYDLADSKPWIEHPIIGLVAVPAGVRQRSERAMLMTHEVASKLRLYPPSVATIRNIVSKFGANFVSQIARHRM